MITAAERRAKIEKLKRDRELKEQEKKAREEQKINEREKNKTSNDLITEILKKTTDNKDKQLLEKGPGGAKQEELTVEPKSTLRVSPYVAEMWIVPQKKPTTYEKDVQCDLEVPKPKRLDVITEDGEWDDEFDARMEQHLRKNQPDRASRKSSSTPKTGLVEINFQSGKQEQEQQKIEVEELPKDEIKQIVASKEFEKFFENSTRLMERALGQEFNIMDDFFAEDDKEKGNIKNEKSKLTKKFTFQENELLNRAVTSIDWSPSQSELLLASYSKSGEWDLDSPDGRIDIFSLSMQGRPELTLNCQYEVTKAIFNPHNPNVIIGATMTGYLLEWDIRAKKDPINTIVDRRNRSQPIQKSCLAQNGHQYPVYSLSVIGYQNSHHIVSISNDGKMCTWKPQVLADPRDYTMLQAPKRMVSSDGAPVESMQQTSGAESKVINAHCLDFAEGEQETFYIGSEDFSIYQCNLRSENFVQSKLDGHDAPVTGVDVHPGISQSEKHSEMSDMLLSSSMDWTVKLWMPKSRTSPVMTFESAQEYVYDAQWSPTHPSVFASCDAEGYVDIWNINKDIETPIVRKQVQDKPRPFNCLRWSKDGRRMACGDSQGYVTILGVDQELVQPKQDDFDKILDLVQQYR